MLKKSFHSLEVDYDASKLGRYSKDNLVRKVNDKCFDITSPSDYLVLVDQEDFDKGKHVVRVKMHGFIDPDDKTLYGVPISSPLTDEEFPAYMRGMINACELARQY